MNLDSGKAGVFKANQFVRESRNARTHRFKKAGAIGFRVDSTLSDAGVRKSGELAHAPRRDGRPWLRNLVMVGTRPISLLERYGLPTKAINMNS